MRIAVASLIGFVTSTLVCAAACSGEHFPSPLTSAPLDGGGRLSDASGDAGLPPLEGSFPAPIPSSRQLDVASSPVTFDRLRGGAWTANGDVGTVSYANVDSFTLAAEIAVGQDVRSVALSPDGRWLAAVDRGAGTVALIDPDARVVRRTIALGAHPRAAVWDAADPRWLYVAVEGDGVVAVVDRSLGVVARTVAAGRLPSGVAVSRQRRELYVTHRIDGAVTILPLDGTSLAPVPSPGSDGGAADVDAEAGSPGPGAGAASFDVELAPEIGDGRPTNPHGTPFALESLAWAPDGDTAWIPHELLASTHPFQFQSVLFPAVSVVDLSARAEVQTDPFDPNGVIAGRKNLFDAISILDDTGNVTIVSQPCAAAFHPNGYTAYVLTCASEGLLTFDLTQGIAVDLLRDLPGDHPVGMALDDTGQRAFVLSDQTDPSGTPSGASKSLTVIDVAGGALLGHARVIGTPIGLASADPVDPDLRAGLRLFFRSNSSKGALAVAGNSWMACGSCHLDGFTSTNAAFFVDLAPADAARDARIGHSGLADLFSRTPPPNDPADPPFDPHDVLVAFEEQGGLAPDRTGASRAGAIDPSAPTADAVAMARQVAKVIARDLPLGPTWLLSGGAPAPAAMDGAWCGQCHAAEYQAWSKSAHAHSAVDPMVVFGAGVESKIVGPQFQRLCAGCHDPVSARGGDTSLSAGRGITCLGCHETERLIQAGGNMDLQAQAYDWTQSHAARASAGLSTLREPEFCGGCHQQFVPGTGLAAIGTLEEWRTSPFAGTDGGAPAARCVDCHAPRDAEGRADHAMVGGNVYLASEITRDPDMAKSEQANLGKAITLGASRVKSTVFVTVHNVGAGHAFPTGVVDIREPWVELQAVDAQHQVVARYGGPTDAGTLPPAAARLGMDIADADGGILYLHELSQAARIPFLLSVPAGGSAGLTVEGAPDTLPAGAVELDAVLLYRNVRTPYFRAATGDAGAAAPDVEVARVVVP